MTDFKSDATTDFGVFRDYCNLVIYDMDSGYQKTQHLNPPFKGDLTVSKEDGMLVIDWAKKHMKKYTLERMVRDFSTICNVQKITMVKKTENATQKLSNYHQLLKDGKEIGFITSMQEYGKNYQATGELGSFTIYLYNK